MTPWQVLETAPAPAAENMAVDEALLELASHRAAPVLRFYGWSEPAASFGFFQRFRDIEQMTPLRPLVRRPTGGGLVPHDRDWTYSLVFPPSAEWYRAKATESYERVHAWVNAGFHKLGVSSQLAPQASHTAAGQCFVGSERFDVVIGDRKIAGAAQRRNKLGLLIQGSVQPPPGVKRDEWQAALCGLATVRWNVCWAPFAPRADWNQRVQQLIAEKYSRREYNERR